MQSWTSQPRKSRSSCKNMQSIPSIKPKAPENAWQRLQKIVFAFAWKSGPVQAGQWQLRPQNVARLPSLFSFPISARVQIIPACLGENQAGSNMTMLHPAIAPRLAGQGTCSTSSPAAAVVSCPVCAPRRSARRQQSSRAQRSGSVETSSRSESRPAQHLDYLPGVRPSEQEHNAFGRPPDPEEQQEDHITVHSPLPQTSLGGSPVPAVSSEEQHEDDNILQHILHFARDKLRQAANPAPLLDPDHTRYPMVPAKFAYGILGANLIMYSAGLLTGLLKGSHAAERYFLTFCQINERIIGGEYYRLASSSFLHDSFAHLCTSSYALWTIAPQVESVLGSGTFLGVYYLSGLAGNVLSFVYGDAITVGASSATFGLIGSLAGFLLRNHSSQKDASQLMSIGFAVVTNLVMGASDHSYIDNLGHVGGLLSGLLLGYSMCPIYSPHHVESGVALDALPEDKQAHPEDQDPLQDDPNGSPSFASSSTKEAASHAPASPTAHALMPAPERQLLNGPSRQNILAALSGDSDIRDKDERGALKRWSAGIGFAISLFSIVAGKIFERTGQIPLPKDINMLDVIT